MSTTITVAPTTTAAPPAAATDPPPVAASTPVGDTTHAIGDAASSVPAYPATAAGSSS